MNLKEGIKTQCTHHWIIPPAMGSASLGVCKLCGETKSFKNSYPVSGDWVKDPRGVFKGGKKDEPS